MNPFVLRNISQEEDFFPFIQYLNDCGKREETAIVILTTSLITDRRERELMNLVIDANISTRLITISLISRLEDGLGADIFLKGDERYTGGTVYRKGEMVPQSEITGDWRAAFEILKGYTQEEPKPFKIVGNITAETNVRLLSYLLACSSKQVDATITIWSGGGDCSLLAPLKLASEMVPKITTIGIKTVGSTAASIFLFGTKRFLCPGTTYLVHHPKFEAKTKIHADEMVGLVEDLKGIWTVMKDLILIKTNINPDVLTENTANGKDWRIDVAECKKLGITTGDYEEGRKYL